MPVSARNRALGHPRPLRDCAVLSISPETHFEYVIHDDVGIRIMDALVARPEGFEHHGSDGVADG